MTYPCWLTILLVLHAQRALLDQKEQVALAEGQWSHLSACRYVGHVSMATSISNNGAVLVHFVEHGTSTSNLCVLMVHAACPAL